MKYKVGDRVISIGCSGTIAGKTYTVQESPEYTSEEDALRIIEGESDWCNCQYKWKLATTFQMGDLVTDGTDDYYYVAKKEKSILSIVEFVKEGKGWKRDSIIPSTYRSIGTDNYWHITDNYLSHKLQGLTYDKVVIDEIASFRKFNWEPWTYSVGIDLAIIKPKQTIMSKLNSMMKQLLDIDTLQTILFSANKAALVAEAQAKLDTEKKN